ncbi:MAG: hypothetical protein AB1461_11885 [Thermodesulfobacteriota bacterium]
MAVPDFQSFFLPLLKFCSDGKAHSAKEAYAAMADYYGELTLKPLGIGMFGAERQFDVSKASREIFVEAGMPIGELMMFSKSPTAAAWISRQRKTGIRDL